MNNINVKQFFYYDELSDEAKAQARINVLVPEYEAKSRDIKKALSTWCENSNKAINDPYHIKRLINGSAALRKVKQFGDDYLIRYIRDNRTIFTDSGDYVYYMGTIAIISDGVTHLICDPDAARLAKQAYIDVNDRGPAYHNNLYRTWHRIKHFMIVNNKG